MLCIVRDAMLLIHLLISFLLIKALRFFFSFVFLSSFVINISFLKFSILFIHCLLQDESQGSLL